MAVLRHWLPAMGSRTVSLASIMVAMILAALSPLAQDRVEATDSTPRLATLDELRAFLGTGNAAPPDRAAAERGDADAQFRLGYLHANGGSGVPHDDAEAVRWYRLAAEQGHAEAQLQLGYSYFRGAGVPQDDAKGVHWHRAAANQGHPDAQIALGAAHALGRGVLKDEVEAVGWYRLAAKQGNSQAQWRLGMKYIGGGAILKDYVLAHMWLNIASANGQDVGVLRDKIETSMTRPQILRATELARICMESNYRACEPQ